MIILGLLIFTSCSKAGDSYQKQDIKIIENHKQSQSKESYELQINGLYQVIEDTYMYESADKNSKYDEILKASVVKVLQEKEGNFIWVDYNGNQGYVEVSILKEI